MNSKSTYIDPNMSSSYPFNFMNQRNMNPYGNNNWNSNGMNTNMNAMYMNSMNGMNQNNSMNTINNMNNMNGMNNLNGINMNNVSVPFYNENNNNVGTNFNQGFGTLSQSIAPTFSSRNNNNNNIYNPSDYINDNFVNKTNNYKATVNDFSNANTQNSYESSSSSSNNFSNQNMTIKRNKKEFLDAKASIQSKIKKSNIDYNSDFKLDKNEQMTENNINNFTAKNGNLKPTIQIVDDKKIIDDKQQLKKDTTTNKISDDKNQEIFLQLIHEIKNIIHS